MVVTSTEQTLPVELQWRQYAGREMCGVSEEMGMLEGETAR
jgi:hypothetical protein